MRSVSERKRVRRFGSLEKWAIFNSRGFRLILMFYVDFCLNFNFAISFE